jgi:hypothetical protein
MVVTSKVTPIKLEVLLHYHYSSESYSEGKTESSPATEEAVRFWLNNQMLELSPDEDDDNSDLCDNRYITTDKGKVYIEALCSMSFPIPSWSIPRLTE